MKEDKSPEQGDSGRSKDKLRTALNTAGAEKWIIDELLKSPKLEKVTIPIYSRAGINPDLHDFSLVRLPDFLEWFEREFPNGVLSWDPDYEGGERGSHKFALKVAFNVQEDDQEAHFMVEPTPLEVESYHNRLSSLSYKGKDAVKANDLVYGR
jgi:hypothetical protein